MGSTPTYNLPWPELGGDADGPAAFKALAEATEAALSVLYGDTHWVVDPSDVLTVGSGWNITNLNLRKVGVSVAAIRVTFTRTGGTITVPTSGDIANQTIATFTDFSWVPELTQPLGPAFTGRACAGNIGTSGAPTLALTAVAGTTNIVDGDNLQLGGVYLLGI